MIAKRITDVQTRWDFFNILPRLTLSNVVLLLAVVITLWLLIVPMLLLILNSVRTGLPTFLGGPYTLRNYILVFTSPFFYQALINTAVISVISTLGGLAIAVVFAWLIERT